MPGTPARRAGGAVVGIATCLLALAPASAVRPSLTTPYLRAWTHRATNTDRISHSTADTRTAATVSGRLRAIANAGNDTMTEAAYGGSSALAEATIVTRVIRTATGLVRGVVHLRGIADSHVESQLGQAASRVALAVGFCRAGDACRQPQEVNVPASETIGPLPGVADAEGVHGRLDVRFALDTLGHGCPRFPFQIIVTVRSQADATQASSARAVADFVLSSITLEDSGC